MRRSSSLLVLLAAFVLLGASSLTLAQPTPADAENAQNAAPRYERAWSLMSEDLLESAFERLKTPWEPNWSPSERDRELLRKAQESIRTLIKASAAPECEFEIDASVGLGTPLPHLEKMQRSAMLLAADARLKLDAGEIDAAVERLAAGYRLAEHAARGPMNVSSINAASVFAAADHIAAYADKRDLLNEKHIETLAKTFQRFNPEDPFHHVASLKEGRRIMLEWLHDELLGKDPDKRIDGKMSRAFPDLNAEDQAVLKTWVISVDRVYQMALDAWSEADAAGRLEKLEKAVSDNVHGPLAQMVTPSFSRYRRHQMRSRDLFTKASERFRK